MNVTDYNHLMNKPDAITEKQADALGAVLNEFPYFQSARALRLKGLYDQNSFKYNYALKVTAAHTTDRSVLFDFITSENFTTIQGEYYDQKLRDLLQINVVDSELISPTAIKKTEVRIDPIEKSILDSIKEATNVTFEKPLITETKIEPISEAIKTIEEVTFVEVIKTEETKTEPVVDSSIAEAVKTIEGITFEEAIKTDETKIEPVFDSSIADAVRTIEGITFEEAVKTEQIKIEPVVDPSIAEAVKTIEAVTFEEPKNTEQTTTEPVIDPSITEAVKTIESVTFEEPVQTQEIRLEPVIEQAALDAVKTVETVIFEEIEKTEEPKSEEPEIEAHVVNAIKEIEATIPEVRIDPIEKAEIASIEKASTVVFEEKTEEIKETIVPEVKTAIEHLEIGKPLDFSTNEKHSFQEWLQLAKTEPIDRTNEVLKEAQKEKIAVKNETEDLERKKKEEIINKFIETNPKIPPIKPTAIVPTVQLDPNKNEDNSYLMTETLARVYLEQKKYTKAIQAYEILILKYPEKITFFADRISDIKILQQNNNNNN